MRQSKKKFQTLQKNTVQKKQRKASKKKAKMHQRQLNSENFQQMISNASKKLLNFYTASLFGNIEIYKLSLKYFVNALVLNKTQQHKSQDEEKRYKLFIKQTLFLVYKQHLQNLGLQINMFTKLKAIWHLLYAFCYQLLEDKQIKLRIFSLQNKFNEVKFRKFMFHSIINSLMENTSSFYFIIKQLQNNQYNWQQIISQKYLQQFSRPKIRLMSQITAKISYVYNDKHFFLISSQIIDSVLNSKSLALIYTFYFNKIKQNMNINFNKIKQIEYSDISLHMKLVKVFLIDYTNVKVSSFILTNNKTDNEYPIFLNTYILKQQYDYYTKDRYMKMYMTIILISQLSHYLYKKLQINKQIQQQMNTKQVSFQKFLFGSPIKYLLYQDYLKIAKLLNLIQTQIDISILQSWFKQAETDNLQNENQKQIKNKKNCFFHENVMQLSQKQQKQVQQEKYMQKISVQQSIQKQISFCQQNLKLIQILKTSKFKVPLISKYDLQNLKLNKLEEQRMEQNSNFNQQEGKQHKKNQKITKLYTKKMVQKLLDNIHQIGKKNRQILNISASTDTWISFKGVYNKYSKQTKHYSHCATHGHPKAPTIKSSDDQ